MIQQWMLNCFAMNQDGEKGPASPFTVTPYYSIPLGPGSSYRPRPVFSFSPPRVSAGTLSRNYFNFEELVPVLDI